MSGGQVDPKIVLLWVGTSTKIVCFIAMLNGDQFSFSSHAVHGDVIIHDNSSTVERQASLLNDPPLLPQDSEAMFIERHSCICIGQIYYRVPRRLPTKASCQCRGYEKAIPRFAEDDGKAKHPDFAGFAYPGP